MPRSDLRTGSRSGAASGNWPRPEAQQRAALLTVALMRATGRCCRRGARLGGRGCKAVCDALAAAAASASAAAAAAAAAAAGFGDGVEVGGGIRELVLAWVPARTRRNSRITAGDTFMRISSLRDPSILLHNQSYLFVQAYRRHTAPVCLQDAIALSIPEQYAWKRLLWMLLCKATPVCLQEEP